MCRIWNRTIPFIVKKKWAVQRVGPVNIFGSNDRINGDSATLGTVRYSAYSVVY